MPSSLPAANSSLSEDPARSNVLPWGDRVRLDPDERVVAGCRFDLDSGLRFFDGCVVLTDRRLIADLPTDHADAGVSTVPQAWPLGPDMQLVSHLRGPVGRLDLWQEGRLLARWLFTAARARNVHAVVDAFATRGDVGGDVPRFSADATPDNGMAAAVRPPSGRATEDDAPPPAGGASLRSLVRLLDFARPHAGAATLGVALTLASTVAALVPPYLTMPLVDDVLIPRQSGQDVAFSLVARYLGLLLVAALAAWLLSWAQTWTLAWVSERIAAGLRTRTYAHIQSLSLDFFQTRRTGDLIARVGTDTDRLNIFLSVNLIEFASNVMLVALTVAVLVWLQPTLALLTLVPFPLVLWLAHGVRSRLRRGFGRASVAWGEMMSVLTDSIPGVRVVKAFAQEIREIDRFRTANDRVLEANDRVNLVWSFFGPLVRFFNEVGLLVVWAAGAWLVFGGGVTVGGLTAFIAYISRFYARVESMILMVPATQRAAASAQRIFDILDCRPSVAEPRQPVRPGRLAGRIEIENVHFRYGAREVLHGIDLVIEPGEMIGLVGTSGSGKSTLANLICRFYDPSSGTIRVDGIDLRDLAIADYRRSLGCVLQEPFLFFGTIAENIAYGRPDASRERIVAAARAAGAHDFILAQPLAYDSRVGERGGTLSGGERQRISIARALLVDPRILILDEATSSVDTETEAIIQAAIDRLVEGRTTIAIAHRLSTLRRADRIVVLDAGRIVETGTHDELLALEGIYTRLHRAQQKAATEALSVTT
jgi:ATP-binding cassette subfamily B protein